MYYSILLIGFFLFIKISLLSQIASITFFAKCSIAQQLTHFVYERTPQNWLSEARNYGKNARHNLTTIFLERRQMGAESLRFYADYLNRCSSVDELFMPKSEDALMKLDKQPRTKNLVADFAFALGFDDTIANLMALPTHLRHRRIASNCARNELRMQCALGFYNNQMAKLQEHMDFIKQLDGVFTVMIESECKNAAQQLDVAQLNAGDESQKEVTETDGENVDPDDPTAVVSQFPMNSVFQCIHEKAIVFTAKCAAVLVNYNQTRQRVNAQMHRILFDRIEALDQQLTNVEDDNEENNEEILRNGANSLRATLKLLANIEGPKCDAFTKIMQCLAENMRNSCGEHAYTELETMLKIGYLERERGDLMHAQFREFAIQTNEQCANM